MSTIIKLPIRKFWFDTHPAWWFPIPGIGMVNLHDENLSDEVKLAIALYFEPLYEATLKKEQEIDQKLIDK